MLLVFQDPKKSNRVVVRWALLPFFICSNGDLVKRVGDRLTTSFKGQHITDVSLLSMHDIVVDEIALSYHWVTGLKRFIEGIREMEVDQPDLLELNREFT